MTGLYLHEAVTAEVIEAAILEGLLPALFESLTRAAPRSAYVVELLRRGFAGIKWDSQLLDRFSGRN